MAMNSDLDLSKLSLSDRFEPKLVRRDTDLIRRLEAYTAVGRPCSYLNCSTSYRLVSLKQHSHEYRRVIDRINQSYTKVIEVQQIQNVYLWEQFCLKRAFKMESHPSTTVMELFHGTREANVDSICKNNLDWRRMGTTGYLGNKYGSGVSFSPFFDYARQFPRGDRSSVRTMLLCDVLVDKMHHGNNSVRIPLKGYDATVSPNGKVIVKYDDNEFYPKYVIKYLK